VSAEVSQVVVSEAEKHFSDLFDVRDERSMNKRSLTNQKPFSHLMFVIPRAAAVNFFVNGSLSYPARMSSRTARVKNGAYGEMNLSPFAKQECHDGR
jgi:hypothetical protein